MKLVLGNASDFKKSIDAIAVLVDEAEFIVDDKGFYLKATDPSQISMVDFQLAKSAFKEFTVKSSTKIAVDLDYLSQIMSRAKSDDELTLSLGQENSKLEITFSGSAKRQFLIPLLDISTAEIPSPKIQFDAELKLKAGILQDGFKDASLIGTHVSLGVTDKAFFMKAVSSKGNLNNEISSNQKDSLFEFKVSKESRAMFPLDYLQGMIKAASSDSEVTVLLKSNSPVKMNYKIGEAEITYFLAPRVESE